MKYKEADIKFTDRSQFSILFENTFKRIVYLFVQKHFHDSAWVPTRKVNGYSAFYVLGRQKTKAARLDTYNTLVLPVPLDTLQSQTSVFSKIFNTVSRN